jgi:hypothetical protein
MKTREQLQQFIDLEVAKAEASFLSGVYSLDKSIGAMATASQLAALIDDLERIEAIGRKMWALREEHDRRLTEWRPTPEII